MRPETPATATRSANGQTVALTGRAFPFGRADYREEHHRQQHRQEHHDAADAVVGQRRAHGRHPALSSWSAAKRPMTPRSCSGLASSAVTTSAVHSGYPDSRSASAMRAARPKVNLERLTEAELLPG